MHGEQRRCIRTLQQLHAIPCGLKTGIASPLIAGDVVIGVDDARARRRRNPVRWPPPHPARGASARRSTRSTRRAARLPRRRATSRRRRRAASSRLAQHGRDTSAAPAVDCSERRLHGASRRRYRVGIECNDERASRPVIHRRLRSLPLAILGRRGSARPEALQQRAELAALNDLAGTAQESSQPGRGCERHRSMRRTSRIATTASARCVARARSQFAPAHAHPRDEPARKPLRWSRAGGDTFAGSLRSRSRSRCDRAASAQLRAGRDSETKRSGRCSFGRRCAAPTAAASPSALSGMR